MNRNLLAFMAIIVLLQAKFALAQTAKDLIVDDFTTGAALEWTLPGTWRILNNNCPAQDDAQFDACLLNTSATKTTNRVRYDSHYESTVFDISGYRYFKFWYYIDRPDRINFSRANQNRDVGEVEISSSTSVDREEIFWRFNEEDILRNLRPGWNPIVLDLRNSRSTPTAMDRTELRRIRIYHYLTGSVRTGIDNPHFSNDPNLPF